MWRMGTLTKEVCSSPGVEVGSVVENGWPLILQEVLVSLTGLTGPPKMVADRPHPRQQVLTFLLLSRFRKLFGQVLAHMPDIKLMAKHCNTSVTISCYHGDVQPRIPHSVDATAKDFLLHSNRTGCLSFLHYSKINDLPRPLKHEGVRTVLGTIARTVATTISTDRLFYIIVHLHEMQWKTLRTYVYTCLDATPGTCATACGAPPIATCGRSTLTTWEAAIPTTFGRTTTPAITWGTPTPTFFSSPSSTSLSSSSSVLASSLSFADTVGLYSGGVELELDNRFTNCVAGLVPGRSSIME